jgi:ribosome-binding protein aMBF1 (putative translation factor)
LTLLPTVTRFGPVGNRAEFTSSVPTNGRPGRREVQRWVNPARIPVVIISRRIALGWSQRDLAGHLMVNPSTVARWETGDRVPGGPELLDLMAVLGFSRDELV